MDMDIRSRTVGINKLKRVMDTRNNPIMVTGTRNKTDMGTRRNRLFRFRNPERVMLEWEWVLD
jgi:hypothetical protein